jgi:hypothetical protein
MDFLTAKAELVAWTVGRDDVRGISVLGKNHFGVYLWDETAVELPVLEEYVLEVVPPSRMKEVKERLDSERKAAEERGETRRRSRPRS